MTTKISTFDTIMTIWFVMCGMAMLGLLLNCLYDEMYGLSVLFFLGYVCCFKLWMLLMSKSYKT